MQSLSGTSVSKRKPAAKVSLATLFDEVGELEEGSADIDGHPTFDASVWEKWISKETSPSVSYRAMHDDADDIKDRTFLTSVLESSFAPSTPESPTSDLDDEGSDDKHSAAPELSHSSLYYGNGARWEFLSLGRKVFGQKEETEAIPETARHSYLRSCRDRRIAPEPSVIRKQKSETLRLAHFGLGGTRSSLVAQIIDKLPSLHSLDMSDNRMGAKSTQEIIDKLSSMARLRKWNMSHNPLNKVATKALCTFLNKPGTSLVSLTLSNCNLDDDQSCMLAKALISNVSLTALDISSNKVGVNGASMLGELLERNRTLQELNVSSNLIRGLGAIAIARAVEYSSSIRKINLSFNSLGRTLHAGEVTAAEVLGVGLANSETLTWLDVSQNSISTAGAVCLAYGAGRSTCLQHLDLGNNPVGREGVHAVVRAVVQRGKLSVPFHVIVDQAAVTHPTNMTAALKAFKNAQDIPIGKHTMSLSIPLHRVLAANLIQTASEDQSLSLTRVTLSPEEDPSARSELSIERLPTFKDGLTAGTYVLAGGAPLTLPDTGILELEVTRKPKLSEYRTSAVSSDAVLRVLDFAKQFDKELSVQIFELFAKDSFMFSQHAVLLLTSLPPGIRLAALSSLIPQILDRENTHVVIKLVLNKAQIKSLELFLGKFLDVMFTPDACCAHYSLNLSSSQDRSILDRLIGMNNEEKHLNTIVDTSQLGDGTNFRNVYLNGKQFSIPTTFETDTAVMPNAGRLVFDYVTKMRQGVSANIAGHAASSDEAMSDDELVAMLVRLNLKENAMLIDHFCKSAALDTSQWVMLHGQAGEESEGPKPVHHPLDTSSRRKYNLKRRKLSRVVAKIVHVNIVLQNMLIYLRMELRDKILSSAQASRILRTLPSDIFMCRVEALVIMFSRLSKLQDLRACLVELNAKEINEVARRIGWLNIGNPEHPDGDFKLDLALRDEREMARTLIELEGSEPGNIVDASYTPPGQAAPEEGWKLPSSWMAKIGVEEGVLRLSFKTRTENRTVEEMKRGAAASASTFAKLAAAASTAATNELSSHAPASEDAKKTVTVSNIKPELRLAMKTRFLIVLEEPVHQHTVSVVPKEFKAKFKTRTSMLMKCVNVEELLHFSTFSKIASTTYSPEQLQGILARDEFGVSKEFGLMDDRNQLVALATALPEYLEIMRKYRGTSKLFSSLAPRIVLGMLYNEYVTRKMSVRVD